MRDWEGTDRLAGIGDLAGDSHILVIHAVAAGRESVQIKERTEATLDTPEGTADTSVAPGAKGPQNWCR